MKTTRKKTAKRRAVKLPVRLNAKPTGPYNAKKGKRGYVRPRDKRLISPELLEYGEGC